MKIWLLIALNFACAGILQLMSSSGSFVWLSAGPDDGYPVYFGWLSIAISSIIVFALPAIVYANVFPPERFKWFKVGVKVHPMSLVYGMLAMLCAVLAFDLIANWLSDLITDPALKDLQELSDKNMVWLMQMPTVGDLLACLFVSAFLPAICEELFFRAGLQQLFQEWTKKPHLSIFITAIYFSLLHFNPSGFPVIFLGGLMLGYAFYWSGSLRVGILMHFVFNASSILISYFAQHSPAFAKWEPSVGISLGGLGLTMVFMFLLWRQTQKRING